MRRVRSHLLPAPYRRPTCHHRRSSSGPGRVGASSVVDLQRTDGLDRAQHGRRPRTIPLSQRSLGPHAPLSPTSGTRVVRTVCRSKYPPSSSSSVWVNAETTYGFFVSTWIRPAGRIVSPPLQRTHAPDPLQTTSTSRTLKSNVSLPIRFHPTPTPPIHFHPRSSRATGACDSRLRKLYTSLYT